MSSPSKLFVRVVLFCILIMNDYLVSLASAQCLCAGFSFNGGSCATGTATPTVSSSCAVSSAVTISYSLSTMNSWNIGVNRSRAEVNVALLTGYTFSSAVTVSLDMCAPDVSSVPDQRRLTLNISGNTFVSGATLAVALLNSCGATTTKRNAVYHAFLGSNNFSLVSVDMGGTFSTGAVAMSGTVPFGHWLSFNQNRLIVYASKSITSSSDAASFDRTLVGVSVTGLTMAAPTASVGTSLNGADWSFCQTLLQNNWMMLNLTMTNQTSLPLWRNSTSFVVVGIATPTASSMESLARLQILSNTINLNITTSTTPIALLGWSNAETSSTAPPGRISDAAVGILWSSTSAANVTFQAGSIVELNANSMYIACKNAAAYGIWQGTTESMLPTTAVVVTPPLATAAPFIVLSPNAKLHFFTNWFATPKPDLARFVFAIVLTSSMDVATTSSSGSGTLRIETNQLFNVDSSFFTSGVGIMIACPQFLVGFNSLVSIRDNRMWAFPTVEGNLSAPTTLRGGAFSGLSFVPYSLNTGSVAQFSSGGIAPIIMVGSVSFIVIDGNIVYIVARALQPTIMFRSITISGASSACRITGNMLFTTSAQEDPSLSVRNVTMYYGPVVLQGAKSVWVFARQTVYNENFLGGIIAMSDFGVLLPGNATAVCATCELVIGCTARGLFSPDSNSNPGSQLEYVVPLWGYAPPLIAVATQQPSCASSCGTPELACFVPGTREATSYQRNDYLPVCSCRCGLGYSFNRQCGPPQGLNSGSVSFTNGTFEMTLTNTVTLTKDITYSRSTSDTSTSTISITSTDSKTDTTTITTSHTDSITKSESMSPCYNYTAWETDITWPFVQVTPNYYFGNISYTSMFATALPLNISLHPPARVGEHWFDFNRPNWNSPMFNFSFVPFDFHTTESSMVMTSVEKIIGLMSTEYSIATVKSSKYEQILLRWSFVVTNYVCPLRPYFFDIELQITPVLVLVANETRDATAAAMFVAALYGNAPAAALLARAPLMTAIVACYGPMAEYEDSTSMTFYRFGSVRGQYARGGVVGNLIAVGAVIVFYLLALLFLSIITHVSSISLALRNGIESLHLKSIYVGVGLCVLQPTLAAGIALIRNPVDDNDNAIGGIAIGFSAVYVLIICYKLIFDMPDVVLVYDLIRPHQTPKSKIIKFIRYFFWPKYHFLPRNDYRRKIERMLLTEEELGRPAGTEGSHDVSLRQEETEEDNEKLTGLLKMSADEYTKSRRWERLKLGDVLIIPPPPVKEGAVLVERENSDGDPLEDVVLDEVDIGHVEKPEFTDVSRQVQSEMSFEDMFNTYGAKDGGNDDDDPNAGMLGLGIITESERAGAKKKGRGPLNLIELQRIEREEEIRKAKEAAKAARESKIAEIKAKIAAEVAAQQAAAQEAKEKEEERVMVPLQVLELMRMAKSDKHDWYVLIRGWSHPLYALAPHFFAVVMGVSHGFGDDFCRQSTSLLLAVFAVELIVLLATRLRAVVLPFHRAWYIITLLFGLISSICMIVGKEAEVNEALDVAAGFALLYALSCLIRVIVDGISTIFHMRVNSEKSMSLIARGQEILDDEEVELHYTPPPLPVKPEPIEEPPRAPTPPPVKPPTPEPVVEEEVEVDWEDDPNRIFNPLGDADPVPRESDPYGDYTF